MKESASGGNRKAQVPSSLGDWIRRALLVFVCIGTLADTSLSLAKPLNLESLSIEIAATAEDVQLQYRQKNWSRFFGQIKWLRVLERWDQLPEDIQDQLAALEVMALIQHCQWPALQDFHEQNPQPGPLLARALSFVEFSRKPQAKSAEASSNLIEIRKQWQVKEAQALRTQHPSKLQFRVVNRCPKSTKAERSESLPSLPRSPAQVDTDFKSNVSLDPARWSPLDSTSHSSSSIEGEWVLTDEVLEPMGWSLGLGFGTSLGQTYTRTQSGLLQLTYSPWAAAGFGFAHRVFRNELSQFAQVFEREMDLQGLRVQSARVDSSQQFFAELRPILGKFNLFGLRQVDTGLSLRLGLSRRNLSSGGEELGTVAGAFFEIFGARMNFGLGTLLESSNLSNSRSTSAVGDSAEWLLRLGIPLGEARK